MIWQNLDNFLLRWTGAKLNVCVKLSLVLYLFAQTSLAVYNTTTIGVA